MVQIRYPGSPQAADIGGFLGGLDALGGIIDNRRARQSFESLDDWLRAQSGGQPMSLASLEPQPATDPASQRVAQAHNASGNPSYRDAIKSIESKGSGDYAAVGPTHPQLGRALGAYQVMEANIGPWSKEVFGKEMTPEQFLANPKAQDVIFDRKFGSYVEKFGSPEKAAQAWFAGEGGVGTNRQDSLGTSVPEYAQKFTQALGGAPQPAMASMGGGTPQNAPQASQMAQGGSMLPPREVMQQLFRSEQTRPLAIAMAQAAIQARQGGPEAALKMRKLAAEVQALENPQEKPTADLQEYEFAKSQGFTGSFVDFQLAQKKAGATTITTNVGEGDKFFENLDKKNAETFGALSEAGVQARSKLAQIDRLDGLLANAPQGAVGGLKQAIGEFGINTEGLDDIQSAQALINELVPQQRQPGSGPMSDADLALFKQSLPRILNQPNGNQIIIQTMRGIAEYQVKMGEIADAVADREMTPKEGREAIRNLENPLANLPKVGTKGNRTSGGLEWSIEEE